MLLLAWYSSDDSAICAYFWFTGWHCVST